MKKNIIIFLIAIIVGTLIFSIIYYKSFKVNEITSEKDLNVKAFQIGVYTNYDNALKVAERNNGIVVSDNEYYRVYIAILNDQDAIKILEEYYQDIGLKYYLKDVSVTQEFLDIIVEDEELLKNSSTETYTTINIDVLMKYEESL